MTIGEKIRESRKRAGLTQEQLAEKLMVSRQAVCKWEADKGIPDIGNLKAISSLLHVSIDELLDQEQEMNMSVIREQIDLSKYGKNPKTQIVLEKYPDSQICPLIARKKLTKGEKIIDNILGFLFDAPFGMPQLANELKNVDKAYYLVDKDGKQYFVVVSNEYIESREMIKPVMKRRFDINDMRFTRCR